MRTVSVFRNGNNRAIRLPRDLDFDGVNELEIIREGDTLILTGKTQLEFVPPGGKS